MWLPSRCRFFVLLDGVLEVHHGAVKFFLRITALLADFPHQQLRDLIAFRLNERNEFLHRFNAVGGRGRGPNSATVVVGVARRLQCANAFLSGQVRHRPEQGAFGAMFILGKDRASHFARGSSPRLEFAIHQESRSVKHCGHVVRGRWLVRHAIVNQRFARFVRGV